LVYDSHLAVPDFHRGKQDAGEVFKEKRHISSLGHMAFPACCRYYFDSYIINNWECLGK